MPPRIELGDQYDDSTSRTDLRTNPQSNLEMRLGDQHDRSQRIVNADDTGVAANPPNVGPQANPQVSIGEGKELWVKGSFFLVSFITVGVVIGILTHNLPWYLVPGAVVGSILVLYLLALVLIPNGALSEKGLLSLLGAYVRLAFAARPESTRKARP